MAEVGHICPREAVAGKWAVHWETLLHAFLHFTFYTTTPMQPLRFPMSSGLFVNCAGQNLES